MLRLPFVNSIRACTENSNVKIIGIILCCTPRFECNNLNMSRTTMQYDTALYCRRFVHWADHIHMCAVYINLYVIEVYFTRHRTSYLCNLNRPIMLKLHTRLQHRGSYYLRIRVIYCFEDSIYTENSLQ